MYMALSYNKKKLCEVDIYASKIENTEIWNIELSSWFNIKNTLEAYKEKFINNQDFIDDFAYIQDLRLKYMESCDPNLPKNTAYPFGTNYDKMIKDKADLIKAIREKLLQIAKKYNFDYNED